MTKPSLSAIFRQASAAHDSGIAADDVVRLALGERLGNRHAATVEALAGSPAALAAFRAVRDCAPEVRALLDGRRVVVALPAKSAWRPAFALAAGAMGVALVAGMFWRAPAVTGIDAGSSTTAALEDRIFGVSYESDVAVAARPGVGAEDPIFVDEFGG